MNFLEETPHYIGHRRRLRQQFMKLGIDGLQPHEVIELFLTFVIPQQDVKAAAKIVLAKYGSVGAFLVASEASLIETPWIKEKGVTLFRFVREMSELYHKEKAVSRPLSQSKKELISYCQRKLGLLEHEEFWMIALDSNQAVIGEEKISEGVSDRTPVYPKKIMESALKSKAESILLVHNHPGGQTQPSEYDITVTKAIDIPAKILDIKLLDHLIVTNQSYYSLRENGHI